MNMKMRDMKPAIDYIDHEYWGPRTAPADTQSLIDRDGIAIVLVSLGTVFGTALGYFFWG
jgi:hypothetical protein